VDPSRHLSFLIKDVSRLSLKNFERLAGQAGLGLTPEECRVLIYLEHRQGTAQVDLAEYMGSSPMTLMRVLDRMEQEGWVERRPDPEDRRVRRLHLTRAATPVIARIWVIADRARAESQAGLDSADRQRLIGLLERIRGNLLALVEGGDGLACGGGEPPEQVARSSTPGKRKQAAVAARSRARARVQ
jgi:DNA-binding MarR family transcriptional regulator